jgi:DNA repair exonuclease SbcCD ATPase subunit
MLEKSNKLKKEREILVGTVQRLWELGIVFDKYRAWLYEEHILPKLINRANNFVKNVEPNLKLCYNMLSDGTFFFTAKNEHHEVALEKTSGFEYFILSTCLRLAFITLTLGEGVLGGQLMIDEGFTACDVNHLNKIPRFLQSLLVKFDSIILVSHIERIKESVDNTILIQNKEIHYGGKFKFTKPTSVNQKRTSKFNSV